MAVVTSPYEEAAFLLNIRKPRLCPPTGTRWLRMTEEETEIVGDQLATKALMAAKAAIREDLDGALHLQNDLRRSVAELLRTASLAQRADPNGPNTYRMGKDQASAVLARTMFVLRDTVIAKWIMTEVLDLVTVDD